MAPTESQPPYSGSHHKSVAALFGDDLDSQPLWFKKDAFGEPNFDTEAYISDLRRFVPFDTLRAELRSHQAVLKHELVELINRDYTDFVNLSTKLVDVDGAVLRMRMPLNELRGKLLTVRESVSGSLASLQDGLKRRAEASASREILELLLDTSHVVSKVEKLLVELQNMPDNGAHIPNESEESGLQKDAKLGDEQVEHGANVEESRSRLLERIASEMNRLKFYVARAQDLPFIQNMEKRIQNADASLNASLRRSFEGGLERRDDTVIDHCLRAYAAIDNTVGAEEAFRSAVVAPFVQQIIPTSPERRVVGGNSDQLTEVFRQIETRIQTNCKFLLDISAATNSGLHVFDFLSNSVLKEVHSSIQKGRPGAFSPGKPAEFLANYKASLKFLNFLEGYCQSQAAVEKFRSQSAYTEFIKQWNLGVYYTLRFQEIAAALDTAVTTIVATPAQGVLHRDEDGSLGLALQPSSVLWDCLQRCWQEDVFIRAVSDKFLKLTLQLLSRYSTWLSAGLAARRTGNPERPAGGDFAVVAAPEDLILVTHDVKLLGQKIKGPLLQHVEAALTPSSPEIIGLVRQSIYQGADLLLDIAPTLTDVLTEALADKCVEALKQAKGITATYRMTNKPLPTRHSPYVTSILQPLKAFMEAERVIYLTEVAKEELVRSVVEKITTRYDDQAREIITMARRTETTLQRFREGAARKRGGGADTSENSISDTDKICAQLFLDVQDLWKFDLLTNTWEQLNLKGAPSPRSGHRMIMYKHKIILFGGFYDTLRDVRYFNDLHVLDLDDYKWQEIKPKPGQLWPSARSAFQFAAMGDEIFMYGGYFKDHTSTDKEVSEKGVVLSDMWCLDPRTFEWDKVKKIGLPPGPRAGFSLCVHKKRAVFFGGVVDSEDTGDLIRSIFLNDMYGFQMDNRRWYPMELRKAKVTKPKARGRGGRNCGPSTSDKASSDTLAEPLDMDIEEKTELAEQMKGTVLQEQETISGQSNDNLEDEIVRPCGRINAAVVVGKDTLYLYGGMMEIGDREITLDDLYTLDLNKLDSWKCLIEKTEADWVEEEDDDDEDEDEDEDDDEDDEDGDSDDETETKQEGESPAATSSAAEAAAAVLRGEGKKLSRKKRKSEIDRIRAELGLADAQRTPLAGESLRDFFNRTLMYWQEAAYAHTQHTGKELRKDGFDLAESRYKELKPVLDELEKLETEQKAEEEEDVSRMLSMKKSKEKAKSGSRR